MLCPGHRLIHLSLYLCEMRSQCNERWVHNIKLFFEFSGPYWITRIITEIKERKIFQCRLCGWMYHSKLSKIAQKTDSLLSKNQRDKLFPLITSAMSMLVERPFHLPYDKGMLFKTRTKSHIICVFRWNRPKHNQECRGKCHWNERRSIIRTNFHRVKLHTGSRRPVRWRQLEPNVHLMVFHRTDQNLLLLHQILIALPSSWRSRHNSIPWSDQNLAAVAAEDTWQLLGWRLLWGRWVLGVVVGVYLARRLLQRRRERETYEKLIDQDHRSLSIFANSPRIDSIFNVTLSFLST